MQGEDDVKHRRAGVSQTIVNGTIGAPAVFSVLLLLVSALLGWCISKMGDVQDELRRNNTELRILQIHVQDMNAILIKKGLKTPADDETGPTSGTHP